MREPYESVVLAAVLTDVVNELDKATKTHGSFASAHEGWAVLKEEVDELWDEVKRRVKDPVAMRKEAIQVAAMGLRFVFDVCDKEKHDI